MNTNFFTAVPDKGYTDTLNELTKNTICEKLSSIIAQIGEQINIDLSKEIEAFNIVDNQLVNPALFYYYFQLKEAIISEEVDQILDTISLLAHQQTTLKSGKFKYPKIGSVLDQEWEKNLFIKTTRKDIISEFGTENGFEIIRPIFAAKLNSQIDAIKTALNVLVDTDEIHSYAATNYLQAIKVFDGTIRGFSYQAAYGNIYIRIPHEAKDNRAYYLEHIVHECAHQYLFALQIFDPVVVNDNSELYDAPIRIQKRPMNGIFHACFVLARMVRCFRKTNQIFEGTVYSEFQERINHWFDKSYTIVNEHAKLTEQGRKVFTSLKECAYG